jgi:Tfp pilus assembly protein PilF
MVRVLIAAEIDRQQERGGAAHVAFALLDEKGNAHNISADRVQLEKARFSDALSFVVATAVPPGTYTLRLAAARDGRAGSVEHRVEARLVEAASLQLGDLVVCDPPLPGQQVSPSLDSRVRGDRLWSFVQVAPDKEMPAGVSLLLDIVRDEGGPAIVSSPLAVRSVTARSRTAQATFDARLLPPGDYGARLTVSAGGQTVARLFTPFTLEWGAAAAGPGATGRPATSRPTDVAPFDRADALAPPVLDPFLDEVAVRASPASHAAISAARAGRFDEAVAALPSAAPTDPAPPFVRGLALLSKGQLQEASEAFREAIRLAPDLFVGAFYIGACYAAAGNDKSAMSAWQTSLAGLEGHAAVYRFLVDARLRAGQPERAVALLEEALLRFPQDDHLTARMAKALFDMKHYAKALDYASRIIERRPGDASVLELALRSAFEAASTGTPLPYDTLLPRLRRYRAMYSEAQGPEPGLVAEWVAFVEARARK